MYLKELHVHNFRNYESLDLNLHPGINLIYGKNAQGKTNLLESIYVLGLTKSHRSFIDHSLIKEGETSSYLMGVLSYEMLDTKLEIGFDSKRKKIKCDSKEIKKMSDYISKMNIIIFYPDDLELIKSSPDVRRRFLNTELSQLYGTYMNLLTDYNKLLKMRNEFLKKMSKSEPVDDNYFQILSNYFVEKAVSISKMRKKLLDKLNEYVPEIYQNITGNEGFFIQYLPSVSFSSYRLDTMKQEMKEKLEKMKEVEMKLGTTMVGPHRDDFTFYLKEKNLKSYGSQGQQRVSVLATKLAEIQIFKELRGTYPILLLDDVFSELDGKKRTNLLDYIESDIQTIITTTDLSNIDSKILKHAKKIEIEDAKIKTIEEVEEHGRKN